MNAIEIQDVTKIFHTGLKKGNIVALDSVTLSVRPGEIFGLLGPNGAGKTTLVKGLLGMLKFTSGEALINGRPPSDPLSRRKAGFLQENPRFPEHLTGLGLVELAGRLSGLSEAEVGERSIKLLDLVGMGKWADTKVRKYSKGMNQRVGLAQALVSDPEILFLDEPTDGVDPTGKVEIRQVLMLLRDQGKTVFLNSHLLAEVEAVADRVAILSRGKVIRVATVEELTVRECQFEIEAEIGNERIEIPPELGKRLSITSRGMAVALNNPEDINQVIDQLRMRKINIRSVRPARISLEQSFFEAVSQDSGEPL